MIANITCILTGLAGFLFGVRCYVELWRWARQCQQARIAIAYKGKVKMDTPLVEWLLWCNQLEGQAANGRTVFHMGGVTLAIMKGRATPPKARIFAALKLGTWRRKKTQSPEMRSAVRQGVWKATDETDKVA